MRNLVNIGQNYTYQLDPNTEVFDKNYDFNNKIFPGEILTTMAKLST